MTIADRAPSLMGKAFIATGLAHFVAPKPFEAIIPPALPAKRALVYLSGVAELACAYGLLKRTSWAAPASVAVLVTVFPANVQMAVDAQRDANAGRPGAKAKAIGGWARLPFQAPMIWAALQARRPSA